MVNIIILSKTQFAIANRFMDLRTLSKSELQVASSGSFNKSFEPIKQRVLRALGLVSQRWKLSMQNVKKRPSSVEKKKFGTLLGTVTNNERVV